MSVLIVDVFAMLFAFRAKAHVLGCPYRGRSAAVAYSFIHSLKAVSYFLASIMTSFTSTS